jgi:hypothetical protein
MTIKAFYLALCIGYMAVAVLCGSVCWVSVGHGHWVPAFFNALVAVIAVSQIGSIIIRRVLFP